MKAILNPTVAAPASSSKLALAVQKTREQAGAPAPDTVKPQQQRTISTSASASTVARRPSQHEPPSLATRLQSRATRRPRPKTSAASSVGAPGASEVAAAAAQQGGKGAIGQLIAFIADGSNEEKTIASGALWNLSVNDRGVRDENDQSVRDVITAAGAIVPLVALVRDGRGKQREYAIGVIRQLCREGERTNQMAVASAGVIAPLIDLIREGAEDEKAKAAGALRNLALHEGNRLEISVSGGIPLLVALARSGGSAEQIAHASGALKHFEEDPKLKLLVEKEQDAFGL